MPPRVLISLVVLLVVLPALLAACGPTVPPLPGGPSPASGSGGDGGADAHGAGAGADAGADVRGASPPPTMMPMTMMAAGDADARGAAGPDAHDDGAPGARETAGATDVANAGDGGANHDDGGGTPSGDAGDGDAAPAYDGPPPAQPREGEVLIDELLVNPTGTDTGREWIELVNTTALALDLRTLHVADGSKEVAVDAGLLGAGAILALGQSIDPAKNGGAPIAVAYGNTISLNNDGDSITICFGPCADGLILDSVSWGADLGAAYDGHAVMVAPGTGAFCPATLPFGTAGSFGTPGAANPPCAGSNDAGAGDGADASASASADGGDDFDSNAARD